VSTGTRYLVRSGAAVLLGAASVLPTVAPAATTAQAPAAATAPAQSSAAMSETAKPMATQPARQARHETVRKVQTALNQAGFKLKVDGVEGPKTRAALRQYQEKHGLKITGRMDTATLKSLGIG
jgi:peptidoglycan hydrolase-like protein with peptidoglycan-binding domain